MPDPNEFVYIKHKDVDGVGGPVTRQAYEEVHKPKGWTLAKQDEVPETAPSLPASQTTTQKGA